MLGESHGSSHCANNSHGNDLESFPVGTRVRVKTSRNLWREGTVVEAIRDNNGHICISVECDEQWHYNKEFYSGRGAMVYTKNHLRAESH